MEAPATTSPEQTSADATEGAEVTVFRAYEPSEFRDWPSWHRLLRILKSNGGSYGLSGARGAGKSWLMLRAKDWVETEAEGTGRLGGIGLWYPSPSEYDPLAFLASLSDGFATEIDRWYRRSPVVRWNELVAGSFGVAAGLTGAAGVFWRAWEVGAGHVLGTILSLVLGGLIAVTAWQLARMLLGPQRERDLAREARIVRERARYTATYRESRELGVEGGRGLIARGRAARERELVQRPSTLSSMVNDFRALAREAGDVTGRVVIAIDELDKMSEPDKVRALLRDVKGIFEVPHVHFLVSVSDEAARKLSLGALSERNEFNSSFYTVVEAHPAKPADLAELLTARTDGHLPREVALVLAVLAGGNPREVVRLAELAGSVAGGPEAAVAAMRDEALSLRREVVTALEVDGLPSLGEAARIGVFSALPEDAFRSPAALTDLAADALSTLWTPEWEDPAFTARFGEAWRRLMIRLAVAGEIVDARSLVRDPDLADRLRDTVVASSQSAGVARIVLEKNLRVEVRPAGIGTAAAREQIMQAAREYERVRGALAPGDERTAKLDEIAARARSLAPDAQIDSSALLEMLRSAESGDRVVGLAIIEATGDPAGFDDVLRSVEQPATPFEGYQALRALQSLSGGLDPGQREAVEALLRSERWRASVRGDPPRYSMAERLLRTMAAAPD